MSIIQNIFEDNQCFLDDLYSVLLKRCSVASINFCRFRCGTFILGRLKTEDDIQGIWVGLISARPVEDNVFFSEEVALNRPSLNTFAIGDNAEDGVSLCIFILDLECHSQW